MMKIYAVHCHKYVLCSDYSDDYDHVVKMFSTKESAVKYIETEIHKDVISEYENIINDIFDVNKKILRKIKTYDIDDETDVYRELYYTEYEVYD